MRPAIFLAKLYGSDVDGVVAQLVERLVRNEKVAGSIPVGSTILLKTGKPAIRNWQSRLRLLFFRRMSDTAVVAQTPSKAQVFLRRLITTVILWTVILMALFSSNRLISGGVFILIMIFLATAGLAEFYGLVEKRNLVCFKWCGLIGGVLLMTGTFLQLTGEISAVLRAMSGFMIRRPGPTTLKRASSSCSCSVCACGSSFPAATRRAFWRFPRPCLA